MVMKNQVRATPYVNPTPRQLSGGTMDLMGMSDGHFGCLGVEFSGLHGDALG